MKIEFSTDHNVEGKERLAAHVESVVEHAVGHFSDRISRIGVHLGASSRKETGVDDKRCMMEARLDGREPMAVTHNAATLDGAIDGAAAKLARAVATVVEKIQSHR